MWLGGGRFNNRDIRIDILFYGPEDVCFNGDFAVHTFFFIKASVWMVISSLMRGENYIKISDDFFRRLLSPLSWADWAHWLNPTNKNLLRWWLDWKRFWTDGNEFTWNVFDSEIQKNSIWKRFQIEGGTWKVLFVCQIWGSRVLHGHSISIEDKWIKWSRRVFLTNCYHLLKIWDYPWLSVSAFSLHHLRWIKSLGVI